MELSDRDFRRISGFIEKRYGIQMPFPKKVMLQARLQKRAYQIGVSSLKEYVEFLFSDNGQINELDHFAAIVSTHKTEFFREFDHFLTLRQQVLPELHIEGLLRDSLEIWSSASSTGEEVYSIAITVYDYFEKELGVHFPNFRVTGTDISHDIIDFARKAIYKKESLSTIPEYYRNYFMRSKDPGRREIRVVPEIRNFTDFYIQNLMDCEYRLRKQFKIIFCRNVLIYFDRKTQESLLIKLVKLLKSGGFLFIGHSESVTGFNLPVEQVQTTVFRKK